MAKIPKLLLISQELLIKKNNIKSSVKLGGGCINDMSSYCAAVLRLFFKNYRINSIIRNDQKRLNEKFSIHCNDIKNKSMLKKSMD